MRISLAAIFGLTLVAALICAALVNPTPVWCSVVGGAKLILLLGASITIVVSARSTAFWKGFAIAGWGGWLLLNSGSLNNFGSLLNIWAYLLQEAMTDRFNDEGQVLWFMIVVDSLNLLVAACGGVFATFLARSNRSIKTTASAPNAAAREPAPHRDADDRSFTLTVTSPPGSGA